MGRARRCCASAPPLSELRRLVLAVSSVLRPECGDRRTGETPPATGHRPRDRDHHVGGDRISGCAS